MDKIKEVGAKVIALIQYPVKLWYKARDLVVKYPNVALIALIAAVVANFRG